MVTESDPYVDPDIQSLAEKSTFTVVITKCVVTDPVPSTSLSPPTTLARFLQSSSPDAVLRRSLFARLLLAMHQLFLLGVTHNDLHWNNVLISRHSPSDLGYAIDGTSYEYKRVEYSPVIIDWDQAQIKGRPNPVIEDLYDFQPSHDKDACTFVEQWRRYDQKLLVQLTAAIVENYRALVQANEHIDPVLKEELPRYLSNLLNGVTQAAIIPLAIQDFIQAAVDALGPPVGLIRQDRKRRSNPVPGPTTVGDLAEPTQILIKS